MVDYNTQLDIYARWEGARERLVNMQMWGVDFPGSTDLLAAVHRAASNGDVAEFKRTLGHYCMMASRHRSPPNNF